MEHAVGLSFRQEISALKTSLAQAVSHESSLRREIETLKASLRQARNDNYSAELLLKQKNRKSLAQAASTDASLRQEIETLKASLVQSASSKISLIHEVETLKTALTHALTSEREVRASTRDTLEEWKRVGGILLENIGVLRVELAKTEEELAKVKKKQKAKKVIPFVQRLIQGLIQGKGKLVEEMITLEEPLERGACAEVGECVPPFPGSFPGSTQYNFSFRPLEGSSEVHVLFDGLALHRLEKPDPFTVPSTSPSVFRAKLAPELAALERVTAVLQQAANVELRSAHARASSTGSSIFLPKTARNLRLLVVLWEAGEIEQLKNSLMSVAGERGPKMEEGDCSICAEPLTQEETVSVEGCGHETCKDCLRAYIGTRLGEKVWPVLCPICMAEGASRRRAQGIPVLLV
jgi:Ring finger domain